MSKKKSKKPAPAPKPSKLARLRRYAPVAIRVALILAIGATGHVGINRAKDSAHQAGRVEGCKAGAAAVLSILGARAGDAELSEFCSQVLKD